MIDRQSLRACRVLLLTAAACLGVAAIAGDGDPVEGNVQTDDPDRSPPSYQDDSEQVEHGEVVACFDADNPPSDEYLEEVMRLVEQINAGRGGQMLYYTTNRWSGSQGDPKSLTWSFMPDGVDLTDGFGDGDNELFARMDDLFDGDREKWIGLFEDAFDRWTELSGVTYTRVKYNDNDWDDGAAFGSGASSGRRGDIRIGMKYIDGSGGILAYNYFPTDGDMVLDRSENWASSSNNYRKLRNTVGHENGHGLGLMHTCSNDSGILMEPLLSTSFDGPQHDDLRGIERHYGDPFEPNNTSGAAFDAGLLTIGTPIELGDPPPPSISNGSILSIDANAENDWFKFSTDNVVKVTFTLEPIGFTYDDSRQNQNGSCPSNHDTNSLKIANLAMKVYDSSGSTVLASAESKASGETEEIPDLLLDTPGDYLVRVYESDSPAQSQLYRLTLSAECVAPTIDTDPVGKTVCEGESVTFSVAATGSEPLSYQWRRNGLNISGATGTSYTIDSVTSGHAGDYDVVVQNACGTATSSEATLVVDTIPTITDQPDSATVCDGGSVTFTVVAAGSGVLSYQWRKDGVDISGATGSMHTINPVQESDEAGYDVVVSNDCGSVTSDAATLTVEAGPLITDQPDSATVCDGGSITFTIVADGSGVLSYQWRKDGVDISGATESSYTINPVQESDAGSFDVIVTNICGAATSDPATLAVDTPPSITDHPDDQSACVGGSVTFSAAADGSEPLSYQWRKDGADISGATGSSYTIDNVQESDAGDYDVVVTNACGAATSDPARLAVGTGIQITQQPQDQSPCAGDSATFSVTAEGEGLTYQWRKDGADIGGATESSYSIASVGESDAGSYDVVITGDCGSVISDAATLTVQHAPSITDQPDSQTVNAGDPVTFSVVADGAPPLSYQWRKDGVEISGATDSSYTIDAAQPDDAGDYDVVVSNACGPTTSDVATLTVDEGAAPTITEQPQSQDVCEGDPATFDVVAEGSPPLSYQWRHEGVDIDGATSDVFTIEIVGLADAGSYDVVVSNDFGNATSDPASLTVRRRGDSNCDGSIDFDDIDCFVAALISEDSWRACGDVSGCGYLCANDINRSGSVDFDDIDGFVECLINNGCP